MKNHEYGHREYENYVNIVNCIVKALADNHCKQAQVFSNVVELESERRLAIKISGFNAKYKDKIMNIIDNDFCESLVRVADTKTTLTYAF